MTRAREQASDGRVLYHARLRLARLPLRRKLPLFISTLLCVVVATVSWLGYQQLERALLVAAQQRLDNGAQQLAGMLHESLLRIRRDMQRLAENVDVLAAVLSPGAAARGAAEVALARDLPASPMVVRRELYSRRQVLIAAAGSSSTVRHGPPLLTRPDSVATLSGPRAWVGPLRTFEGHVLYDVVAGVLAPNGDTLGVVVETRQLPSTQSVQRLGDLVGRDATFLLGNATHDLWTDLTKVVHGPVLPGDTSTSSDAVPTPIGAKPIVATDRVPSTPWIISLELPRRAALTPARQFLMRAGLMTLLVTSLGAIVAWLLSRSITGPLDDVTRAAEGIAAGDYSRRAAVRVQDELGRLAASFNTMAEQVASTLAATEAAHREAESAGRRLQQAQRMEAVGQLAGGIAHDFNNLLTVISSYGAMILADLPEGAAHAGDIQEILGAAKRASVLTRQLLAFSRRQVLQPQVLNINALTLNLEKMLSRLLQSNIELETRLAPTARHVSADPGQLEQVIVNLVVNARDAMPNGGRITIETANVELDADYAPLHAGATPGSYVVLIVSDTGEGMDDATKARIFEPFFTTKPLGQGTGLGLSTVYGIVKQSGGYVWVYSEPGRGTAFKIYLPAVEGPAVDAAPPPAFEKGATGSARILLVEDEPHVRRIARRILERDGYTVVEAANGAEALRLLESRRDPVALVLTDLVMPEMGGRELATRLRQVSPTSRVVFMSGYTEDAIFRDRTLDEGELFLGKPFTFETLTQKVRQALGTAA